MPIRQQWSPALLAVFGVRPWEVELFTPGELDALIVEARDGGA